MQLTNHAKRRLTQRYKISLNDVETVTFEPLTDESYWIVLNGKIDTLAIVRDEKIITFLHFFHALSNKTFGLS
jgi:hypothetical protein